MMLHIPEVLSKSEVAEIRLMLDQQAWADGLLTAGPLAAEAKQNQQLPTNSPVFDALSKKIASALNRHPLYIAAALPKHMLPPMFNRYAGGGNYANHVDNASQLDRYTGQRVRTDISTTVFLNEPEEYVGGELIVEDTYGSHEVKLPAGDAIVYPASSLHRVDPVTQGVRIASFLWAQSMVRDAWQRSMLFELDMSILKLRGQIGNTPETVALTAHYHNLLRQWGD